MEEFLDSNKVVKEKKVVSTQADIEECNISSLEKPKMINLSKKFPPHIKQKYIDFCKEFEDALAYGDERLKPYDTNIIQNRIPL